ncbi:MAG: hypothetical protein IJ229_14780 [Clostridia bacterium]|nr:hypothetical protein [Clostridia bacterium]MBR1684051.1 hypothetical protein [Clostridia bacterium]
MEKIEVVCDAKDLARLLSLWESAEAAERHFAPCQSALYRSFLKSVWSAEKMVDAVERLKTCLKPLDEAGSLIPSAGGEPAKKLRKGEPAQGGDEAPKEETYGY